MFSDLAFFSLVALEDADGHRAYNEWHQLDHLPENRALPGVAWGDRWARRDDLRHLAPSGEAAMDDVDYAAMYWFRTPGHAHLAAWAKLGADSFQWGRGPLIPGVHRRLLAFFTPVQGYVSPNCPVGPEVLPFRPHRGVLLSLTRFEDPLGLDVHAHHRWSDRERIPALMQVPGVAGAWTFAFRNRQQHGTLPFDTATIDTDVPGSLRIRLLYLDGDPAKTIERVGVREAELDAAGQGCPDPDVERVLLIAACSTIVPWQDW